MRKMKSLVLFFGLLLLSCHSFAQERKVSGTISDDDNKAMAGVTVSNQNTGKKTVTNNAGYYSINAQTGHQLVFSSVGFTTQTVSVGSDDNVSLQMKSEEKVLGQVVVTALGISRSKRSLGYAANDVKGAELAQTQRDNFVNALAGRVPGVTVSGTSGAPGSSTSIVLRGINSISGSNQPLFVIDGLPVNNQTFNANRMVNQTENRTIDFTNRIADLNPEDIESLTILKGPEAAALYGIDAANGAIVVTTKKGKAGRGTLTYGFNYGIEKVGRLPEFQNIYARGTNGILNTNTYSRFGPRYPDGTTFYDNINNFFQTGTAQKHNMAFEGGTGGYTYRLSGSYSSREGVVPTTKYQRATISLNATAQIFRNLRAETNLEYSNTKNQKVSKGENSFYLALLSYPADENMKDFLTPSGSRKRLLTGSEIENPYFDISKNDLHDKGNRFLTNLAFMYDPLTWLGFTGRLGIDVANNEFSVLYHPESNRASGVNGSLDIADQINRVITTQFFASIKENFLHNKLKTTLRLGNAIYDYDDNTNAFRGTGFLEPNFNSINNTTVASQRVKNTILKKRVVGVFGDLNINYNNFVYLTATGRNDWSSTLPSDNNSFFYPSVSTSIVFSEFLKNSSIGNVLTLGRIRGSIAGVGKDAQPYQTNPALLSQTVTGGGFAYDFYAPNPLLRPEKVTSKEIGTELQFFNNRLGFDAAYYQSKSVDQIINNLRISYGTGFILKNINGGELENSGIELILKGTPIQGNEFTWDANINFTKTKSKLTRMPTDLPEYYNSDTWLYANVRNGARLGGPLTTLTALNSYQYNNNGQLLISPNTGLPVLTTNSVWPVAGDRNPDFRMGFYNSFTYKGLNLNFLWDLKKGGDVFNATGEYLFLLGLHPRSIENREANLTVNGVLKDGLQNTASPTPNNIAINPYYNNAFYNSSVIDYDFIEKDVNWFRLRDITLNYQIPSSLLERTKVFKSASVGITVTDLIMFTNYTGGDPGVNGTTTATGGSGSTGIDYGNLPVPKTYNFTVRVGF
jgi:TonB-linked SusC/RagA family outer membrane protein